MSQNLNDFEALLNLIRMIKKMGINIESHAIAKLEKEYISLKFRSIVGLNIGEKNEL